MQGSGQDLAQLGAAFSHAVQQLGEGHERLLAQLQQVESALAQSATRSDEQMAYYVAQARELIDLTLAAQQRLTEDLAQQAQGA